MNRATCAAKAAIARIDALDAAVRETIFTEYHPPRILADAATLDARAAEGEPMPLYGKTVSIKDLFDEAAIITTAGSRLLYDRPAAAADAVAVARLKAAGALCVGRTNMSEFAYSGVGLNPHFGTPESSLGGGLIPGGSTSGGAVGVARGLTDVALGSDTGGSCRIPAAANGVWGFKPTMSSTPRGGAVPLAPSFDTVGVIASNLSDLAVFYGALSGEVAPQQRERRPLNLAIPAGDFTEMDAQSRAFLSDRVEALEKAGHEVTAIDLDFLAQGAALNKAIVSSEALSQYRPHLDRLARIGDPRVLSRIRFALTLSAQDVSQVYAQRKEVVARFAAAVAPFDAVIYPTLAEALPTIAEVERDFDRLNARMLLNPSLINLADGCAVAMPVGRAGSLMICAAAGADWALLGTARQLEVERLVGRVA